MNQYIVFAGVTHNSNGGFNDYKGESTDLELAKALAENAIVEIEKDFEEGSGWAHVLDQRERKIVWKYEAKKKEGKE